MVVSSGGRDTSSPWVASANVPASSISDQVVSKVPFGKPSSVAAADRLAPAGSVKIGRASCRESVDMLVGGADLKKKFDGNMMCACWILHMHMDQYLDSEYRIGHVGMR